AAAEDAAPLASSTAHACAPAASTLPNGVHSIARSACGADGAGAARVVAPSHWAASTPVAVVRVRDTGDGAASDGTATHCVPENDAGYGCSRDDVNDDDDD